MDRQIVYNGAIPLETDILNTNKNAMIGLAKLSAALFGTSTFSNGFSAGQAVVPSLSFLVQPGEIYSLVNMDGTAYSSLAADTTHQILKQGILLDAATLTTAAPVTAGQSINYLVEVAFAETDINGVVLPYYNASNPAVAWSGPANSGTSQFTSRADQAVLTLKAGAAATTGSQVTPTPDANNVGLWVITVANGQTTILAANITQYVGNPTIPLGGGVSNSHNAIYSKNVAGAIDVTLSSQEAAYPIITLTGAITANFNLIVPATSHQWIINNATTGGFAITVKTPSGTGIATAQGSAASLYCDGVNVIGQSAVSFASNAEAQAQTITNKALSPSALAAALQGANQSLGASGYQKLPGGLILQWGSFLATPAGAGTAITFPIAFPSAVYNISSTLQNPSGSTATGTVQMPFILTTSIGLSGFTLQEGGSGSFTGYWFAIGK